VLARFSGIDEIAPDPIELIFLSFSETAQLMAAPKIDALR
jgi:hypothetical protein